MLNSFKFIVLHCCFFSGGLIQAFSIDHILFLVSNAFSCRCTSQSLTSCYSFVLECWRYLGRLVFPFSIRSRYFEVVISFKSFNSTGAIPPFNQLFNDVSFEWALTHRSFPKILPDSSNPPGAIPKFISKFDVRMKSHQSNVFLQDLSNSFVVGSTFLIFNLECLSNFGGVSRRLYRILKTEEEFFPLNLGHSLEDSWF